MKDLSVGFYFVCNAFEFHDKPFCFLPCDPKFSIIIKIANVLIGSEFQSFNNDFVLLPVQSNDISFVIFLGHLDSWTFRLEFNNLSTERTCSFQTNPHNFFVYLHPVGLMMAHNLITVIFYEVKHRIFMQHKVDTILRYKRSRHWGREPSNSGSSDSSVSEFRESRGLGS